MTKELKVYSLFFYLIWSLIFYSCGGKGGHKGEEGIAGEIEVYPRKVIATGQPIATVSVRVYASAEDMTPAQGVKVIIYSSRNTSEETVDFILQPEEETDARGLATGKIGSLVTGTAIVTAEADGKKLCSSFDANRCIPAQASIEFVLECEEGLQECDGLCIDIESDVNNCGGCGIVCSPQHSEGACVQGNCVIESCHQDWADCNQDDSDGCETNISGDARNCGTCGNECEEGLVCISGECQGGCHDNDGDSYADQACGGLDCDDENPEINPEARDICDGIDNDCNDVIDQQPQASLSCDDGNACNGLERCFAGQCFPGVNLECDDGNDCTIDSCDSESGCKNIIADDGTPCGDAGYDLCDNPDSCFQGICQDNFQPPGTLCREAVSVCDLPEFCDGVNGSCPEDVYQPETTVCRESAGICDVVEYCSGTSGYCPEDSFKSSDFECRSAIGVCDEPEYCSGNSPECPDDSVKQNGTVCRTSAGVCDVEEYCDGILKTCPENEFLASGTICRIASGECDVEEVCTGEGPYCPDDGFLTDGTHCTGNGLFCDGIEECRSGVCVSPGNPCSDPASCNEAEDRCGICGNGRIEAGETCDYGFPRRDNCCNTDTCTWVAYGGIDPQGVCTGQHECISNVCDGRGRCIDILASDGTPCGSGSDTACDNPDTCLGGVCVSNIEPAGTMCRPAEGICDVEELCDGINGTCPADRVKGPDFQCREATSVCDVAENCDGVSKVCPQDVYAPNGTPCPDADPCTDDFCNGANVCVHTPSTDPSRNPGWECLESTCDSIDNDCDGCTDEGCGGDVIAQVKVIPYSDGPGLRRISGNGQYGPAGRQLPGRLIIQLNDNSGNPMSCQRIRFAVERAGKVCFGKGGRFVTNRVGTDPEIRRVCNDVDSSTLIGETEVLTDENGQASVGLSLADVVGTTVVSATAISTGEKVFFIATAVPRLSSTLSLPPPSPSANPALGPLDVTIGSGATRTFLGNKNNYTLTIDDISASTGTTNSVPSAPLQAGGTLTITGTQFTDSQPVDGSCGGAPAPGYPKVWIGGVEVTPISVTNTQIVVPIPEGLPGAASVIVNDGTNTTFRSGSGCVPSVANAMAGFWRVPQGIPVFISAKTGSLNGGTIKLKVVAMDSCGNSLPLEGRTIQVWSENPDGTTPSTGVSTGSPGPSGIFTVSALSTGVVRAAIISASVDGISASSNGKVVVVPVPILQPGDYTEDPALGNTNGINSIIYRGGDQSGGLTDTVHINPAMRMQSVDASAYDINWFCTVGIIPSCECPATGVALSSACGRIFETEKNMMLISFTGEGDLRNLPLNGNVAVGGSSFIQILGGYSNTQSSGGIMGLISAQISYEVFLSSGIKNADGMSHGGWLRQVSRQEIETNASGLELYNDRGDSNPSNDEIRNVLLRILIQRSMP